MDPFEKKLQELYRQKKQDDEKFIPPFDAFWSEAQHTTTVKGRWKFFRIAASVAAISMVAIGIAYYFKSLNPRVQTGKEIYNVNLQKQLPSQQLLSQTLTTYIWQWKSPTDKLLTDAMRYIKK